MVLPEVRAELRQALLEFQKGKTTNVDFYLDTFARLCERSQDRAVNAVGKYWSGHCGAWDLQTYRLTGKRALSADDLALAERCDRLLASDCDYAWPEFPQAFALMMFSMITLAVGLIVSLSCLIYLVITILTGRWDQLETVLLVIMIAAWAPGWILARWAKLYEQELIERFWAFGCKECWPFLSETDFHKSRIV